MIATIASIVSALAGATAAGYGIYQSQNEPDPEKGWTSWPRAVIPATQMMQQLFYNPLFAGVQIGESDPQWRGSDERMYAGARGDWNGQMVAQFKPPQMLESLYSNYLTRSYGLPENIARRMSTASISPLKASALPGGAITAGQAATAPQPGSQELVQAAMGYQQPQALRQLDYLQNAANLAQFNSWRVQQLPRVLG